MPVAATSTQLSDIVSAIEKLNTYIASLQSAQHKAAVAGSLSLVQQLSGSFWDANALEERLVSLRTMADVAALEAAVSSIKDATNTLDNQKQQIDTLVKTVGIAATVIDDIAAVVAAIAKL